MFNLLRKYKDHKETRDTSIRLLARENPTSVKPNNPSLIELDQKEISKTNTKNNLPPRDQVQKRFLQAPPK